MSTQPFASMERLAQRAWGLTITKGILTILFGLCAVIFTGGTLHTLILLFGAFWLVEGLVTTFAGLGTRLPGHGWLVFEGILGVVAGAIAMRYPDVGALAILLVIAFWSLTSGFMEIFGAFTLRRTGLADGWGWLLASGVLSVVLGTILFLNPFDGVTAIVWVVGIWAIAYGITVIVRAIRIRRALRAMTSQQLNDQLVG